MDDKARMLRNEYMREYRKKNSQRIREHNIRYWERKAQQQEQESNKN